MSRQCIYTDFAAFHKKLCTYTFCKMLVNISQPYGEKKRFPRENNEEQINRRKEKMVWILIVLASTMIPH